MKGQMGKGKGWAKWVCEFSGWTDGWMDKRLGHSLFEASESVNILSPVTP